MNGTEVMVPPVEGSIMPAAVGIGVIAGVTAIGVGVITYCAWQESKAKQRLYESQIVENRKTGKAFRLALGANG